MAKSIAQLKKNRGSALKSLQEDVKKHGKKDYTDARFWKPTRNNEGSVFAQVRFLPAPPNGEYGEEEHNFVKFFAHSYKGPTGKYYIEQSLTSLDGDHKDPMSEYNNVLWEKIGTKESKDQARKQSRKKKYIANILVVRDASKPENNGKVFLWEFGQKIFDKLTSKIAPPADSGREGVDVFDPWDGANFDVEAHPNKVDDFEFLDYAQSQFGQSEPLYEGNDAKITAMWEQQHSLNQFLSVKNEKFYKPYDELVKCLERAMGAKMIELLDPEFDSSKISDPMAELEKQQGSLDNFLDDDDEEEDDIPTFAMPDTKEEKEPAKTKTKSPEPETSVPEASDDDLQGLADLDDLDDI